MAENPITAALIALAKQMLADDYAANLDGKGGYGDWRMHGRKVSTELALAIRVAACEEAEAWFDETPEARDVKAFAKTLARIEHPGIDSGGLKDGNDDWAYSVTMGLERPYTAVQIGPSGRAWHCIQAPFEPIWLQYVPQARAALAANVLVSMPPT